jgi:hypothetical protein
MAVVRKQFVMLAVNRVVRSSPPSYCTNDPRPWCQRRRAMEVYRDMLSCKKKRKIRFWYLCLGRILVYKRRVKKNFCRKESR